MFCLGQGVMVLGRSFRVTSMVAVCLSFVVTVVAASCSNTSSDRSRESTSSSPVPSVEHEITDFLGLLDPALIEEVAVSAYDPSDGVSLHRTYDSNDPRLSRLDPLLRVLRKPKKISTLLPD